MLDFARRSGLLLLLVAAGLGLVVERLVVTDEEAVAQVIDDAIRGLKDRTPRRLLPLLAESFRFEGRTPEETVDFVQRMLDRHKPTLLELERGAIVTSRSRAEATVHVRALAYGGGWVGRVTLALEEGPDGWRIVEALRAEEDLGPLGVR
jgi:hypothetical protein